MNGPQRLLESEGGRLGAALKQARARVPDDATLAAIAEGLGRQGAPVGQAAPTAAESGVRWGMGAKVGAGLAGVALLIGLASSVRSRWPELERPSVPMAVSAVPSAAPSVSPSSAPESLLRARPAPAFAPDAPPLDVAAPSAGPSPDRLAAERAEGLAQPAPSQRAARPSVATAEASSEAAAQPTAPDSAPPVGERSSSAARTAAPGARTDSGSAPTVAEDEISLLKEARAELAANPARALALTERHRSQFPRGTFGQEREVIAITALVRLGQSAAARERADRFRKAHPRSAYLKQLDRVLGAP